MSKNIIFQFSPSLRFKIVSLNLILLTLIFASSGILLYQWFKWSNYHTLDELLDERAAGIAQSIDTYWDVEKQSAINQGIPLKALTKVNNANFIKIAQHWFEKESHNPDLSSIRIMILDHHARPLIQSQESIRWDKQHFRIKERPVLENNDLAYTIIVAAPLDDLHKQLSHLRFGLLISLPLIILLTGTLSMLIAHVHLSPIDQMIKHIHLQTNMDPHIHMPVPRTHDELQSLAESFNAMIDRIQHDFKTQQQFIQNMSHEIKTPLTIVRGHMEVALMKTRDAHRYELVLKESLDQIHRITRITETLLTLARYDNHEITPQLEQLNSQIILDEIMSDMSILAEKKHLHMHITKSEPFLFWADKEQLLMVLINLVDNAIKYTPPQGHIYLNIRNQEKEMIFEIQDSGVGIPSEDMPHLFERFYRGQNNDKHIKGFGLGLSLVKTILNELGGNIKVRSEFGQGSCFTVTWPKQYP